MGSKAFPQVVTQGLKVVALFQALGMLDGDMWHDETPPPTIRPGTPAGRNRNFPKFRARKCVFSCPFSGQKTGPRDRPSPRPLPAWGQGAGPRPPDPCP